MNFYPITRAVDNGPVLSGWYTQQNHSSVLFFAHGNGFSTRVYEPLLVLLAQKYDLLMFDLPGHGQSPSHEFVGWNQTAEHLHSALQMCEDVTAGRQIDCVAHSLGGMLTILAASVNPATFRSMVLLDPIMFPQPLLLILHVLNRLRLTPLFHPFVKPTLKRRSHWPDKEQALQYFHGRKIFKGWQDEALQSYVEHALKEDTNSVRLCCEPVLEATWFSTLPARLWPSVSALRCPVKLLMGADTYPFSLRAGRYAQKRNRQVKFSVVTGGHCFMQEDPQRASSYVLDALEEKNLINEIDGSDL